VIKRLPSPEYDARKEAILDEGFLLDLNLAEQNVLAGPAWPPVQLDIDGVYYDRTQRGVMITFEIEGDGIRFLSFANLFRS
jgi:hypothetical protein